MSWMTDREKSPVMSPDLFKKYIFPALDGGEKLFLIVMDNFRYDQWRVLSQELAELFTFDEQLYYSILPTATQYSRNAIFSGLMPEQISRMFPDLWVDEDSEEGKNLNEAPLIQTHLERYRRKNTFSYNKVNDSVAADKLLSQFNNLLQNDLNVVVVNFIDILSHAKTDSRMMRELANDEAAYRSLILSWFRHSSVRELFRSMAATGRKVMITTDHGSILVNHAIKIAGDRSTNTNLRYKLGKNLGWFLMADAQRQKGEFIEAASTYSYITKLYYDEPEIVAEAQYKMAQCYSEMDWNYESDELFQRSGQVKTFSTRLTDSTTSFCSDANLLMAFIPSVKPPLSPVLSNESKPIPSNPDNGNDDKVFNTSMSLRSSSEIYSSILF